MKQNFLNKTLFLGGALICLSSCDKAEEKSVQPLDELTTLHQKVSYIKSYKMIQRGMSNGAEFDPVIMERAIYDAQQGFEPLIPASEHTAVMFQLKKEVQAKKNEAKIKQAELNEKEGAEFLAKNATAEGVKVTESGLQYKVITAVDGDAPRPQIGDMVKVRYEGTFLDDTLFDSSSRNDKGVNFKLDEVIAGWREGLQLMKVGEKFEFFIPSELAYGEKGSKGNIGKNATLIFKIELVELNPDVQAEKEANKNEVAARAKARADEAVARAEKKRAAEEKAKAENSNQ